MTLEVLSTHHSSPRRYDPEGQKLKTHCSEASGCQDPPFLTVCVHFIGYYGKHVNVYRKTLE